jgi:hypothetical protein
MRGGAGVDGGLDRFDHQNGEVVVQAGVVTLRALVSLVLRHPTHGGPKVWILDEVGELDPGVDLCRLGVVG